MQAGGCGFEPRYLHQIRERVDRELPELPGRTTVTLIDLVGHGGAPMPERAPARDPPAHVADGDDGL